MRWLLDTHVWLWLLTEPSRLRVTARERLLEEGSELMWSTVCVWEIAVKHESGKLVLPERPEAFIRSRMLSTAASALAIRHEHALRAAALPPHHRDPFDRLLVAQAQVERLTLVTADPLMQQYDVEVLAV